MVVPATPTQSHMKMLVHGAKCSSFTLEPLRILADSFLFHFCILAVEQKNMAAIPFISSEKCNILRWVLHLCV